MYYTEELFMQREFGDSSVQQFSFLKNQQVDEKKPNWVNTLIQRNIVDD